MRVRTNRRRGGRAAPRLALLGVALVVALGLTGVGYAAWQDDVTIVGTATTGTWEEPGDPDDPGDPKGQGWWRQWDRPDRFTQDDMAELLSSIESCWVGGVTVEDIDEVLSGAQGGTMEERFLGHYLVTRLNLAAGKLNPDYVFDLSSVDSNSAEDPVEYLGFDDGYMGSPHIPVKEIVEAIEAKCNTSPDKDGFEIMKDICEALNEA